MRDLFSESSVSPFWECRAFFGGIMKRVLLYICIMAMVLTACGANAGNAAGSADGAEDIEVSSEAETEEETLYVGTEEEIEQYAASYYRSTFKEGEEDPTLYFLTFDKKGKVVFYKETRDTPASIHEFGTWDVNKLGQIHVKLESLEGTYRFMGDGEDGFKVGLVEGDNFLDVSESGQSTTLCKLHWYTGNVKLDFGSDEDAIIKLSCEGEGGQWFEFSALKADCRLEMHDDYDKNADTVIKCRYAISQASHTVILITQLEN